MNPFQALVARWQQSFLGRTWERYTRARGNVLAGGIAYFAFFSIFPALAIGFTVLGLVLGDDSALQARLVDAVNSSLGARVIGTAEGDGVVQVSDLVQTSSLTVASVLGLAVLLFTGLGWLDAMREGIRAVFGRPGAGNPLVGKLRDVGMLAVFGVAVLASAVASVVVSTASHAVLESVGLDGTAGAGTVVRLLSAVAILVVDTVIFAFLFRVLSGVEVPMEHLWRGALVGGIGLGLLKLFGGLLLHRLSANRFLAAFAVVVGLLVWMNLVGRLTLLSASWAATRAREAGALEPAGASDAQPDGPSRVVAERAAQARVTAGTPTYGVRAADRTTLAAGVVLGAAGLAALRVVRGAVRAVVGAARD